MTELLQNPAPPPVRKTHGRLSLRVVTACVTALLLFIASVVLLFYTWLPRQNPSAMIIIQADERFDGAVVSIKPVTPGVSPMTGTITTDDHYRLRFHLPPGAYDVSIRVKGLVLSAGVAHPEALMPAYMRTADLKNLPTTRRMK